PRMHPVGVCRMCVVDVGGRVLAASCVRPCEEGMRVETHSERVEKQRRLLTELLLAEHPTPCEKERATGDCELEALGRKYGLLPFNPSPTGFAGEEGMGVRGDSLADTFALQTASASQSPSPPSPLPRKAGDEGRQEKSRS